MNGITLSSREVLLVRRALNALKTRQQLNALSCSDKQAIVFGDLVDELEELDTKLRQANN